MTWLERSRYALEKQLFVLLAVGAPVVTTSRVEAGARCRVRGVVRAIHDACVESPAGKSCVAWWGAVRRAYEPPITAWSSVADHDGVTFALEDETGSVLVDPRGAEPVCIPSRHDYSSSLDVAPDRVVAMAARFGNEVLFDGDVRYDEIATCEGDRLEIIGVASLRQGGEMGYRGERERVLSFDAASRPLVLRDAG